MDTFRVRMPGADAGPYISSGDTKKQKLRVSKKVPRKVVQQQGWLHRPRRARSRRENRHEMSRMMRQSEYDLCICVESHAERNASHRMRLSFMEGLGRASVGFGRA